MLLGAYGMSSAGLMFEISFLLSTYKIHTLQYISPLFSKFITKFPRVTKLSTSTRLSRFLNLIIYMKLWVSDAATENFSSYDVKTLSCSLIYSRRITYIQKNMMYMHNNIRCTSWEEPPHQVDIINNSNFSTPTNNTSVMERTDDKSDQSKTYSVNWAEIQFNKPQQRNNCHSIQISISNCSINWNKKLNIVHSQFL